MAKLEVADSLVMREQSRLTSVEQLLTYTLTVR